MKYPIIKDFLGKNLAILDKVINPSIKEKINGEYIFTFSTVLEELKSEYIHHENFIEINNDLFQISKYKKIRTNDNKLLIDVLCEHVSYELINYTENEFILEDSNASTGIYSVLAGTGFGVDSVFITAYESINLQKTNRREILYKLANLYKGELKFNKYNISLLQQRGQDRGIEFRIGKNIKGISKEVDATQKDEFYNPKITYEIDVVDLDNIEEYKGLEYFELGDTVKIIDRDLGINLKTRILEVEYDPIQKKNQRVVLGNYIFDYIDNQIEKEKEIKKKVDVLEQKIENFDFEADPQVITEVVKEQVITVETAHVLNAWIRNLYVDYIETNFKAIDPRETIPSHGKRNYIKVKDLNIDFITEDISATQYEELKIPNPKNMSEQINVYYTAIGSHPDAYKYFTITNPSLIHSNLTQEQINQYKVIRRSTSNAQKKMSIAFEDVKIDDWGSTTIMPVITLGIGAGEYLYPSKGKAKVYKNLEGLVLEYYNQNTNGKRTIILNDNGIIIDPGDGTIDIKKLSNVAVFG